MQVLWQQKPWNRKFLNKDFFIRRYSARFEVISQSTVSTTPSSCHTSGSSVCFSFNSIPWLLSLSCSLKIFISSFCSRKLLEKVGWLSSGSIWHIYEAFNNDSSSSLDLFSGISFNCWSASSNGWIEELTTGSGSSPL